MATFEFKSLGSIWQSQTLAIQQAAEAIIADFVHGDVPTTRPRELLLETAGLRMPPRGNVDGRIATSLKYVGAVIKRLNSPGKRRTPEALSGHLCAEVRMAIARGVKEGVPGGGPLIEVAGRQLAPATSLPWYEDPDVPTGGSGPRRK